MAKHATWWTFLRTPQTQYHQQVQGNVLRQNCSNTRLNTDSNRWRWQNFGGVCRQSLRFANTKKFYPSCNSKCQPILGHMMQGLDVEPNPLEENWAEDKELEIIYQDDAMVVVNKPSGLLSVPGKTIKDSAYTRLQAMFPDVEGPFVIHRLDMATSGILVFALTKRANKSLQKQFMARGVQKRYMALLEGVLNAPEGEISLPMRGDPDDRPRQLVCFEHGKHAETYWQLIDVKDGRSKVYMYPKTGRTHQLRVHSAHHMGLNMPMVGDGLYGEKANRLHLHAEMLELDHPYSKERMVFKAECEF